MPHTDTHSDTHIHTHTKGRQSDNRKRVFEKHVKNGYVLFSTLAKTNIFFRWGELWASVISLWGVKSLLFAINSILKLDCKLYFKNIFNFIKKLKVWKI